MEFSAVRFPRKIIIFGAVFVGLDEIETENSTGATVWRCAQSGANHSLPGNSEIYSEFARFSGTSYAHLSLQGSMLQSFAEKTR